MPLVQTPQGQCPVAGQAPPQPLRARDSSDSSATGEAATRSAKNEVRKMAVNFILSVGGLWRRWCEVFEFVWVVRIRKRSQLVDVQRVYIHDQILHQEHTLGSTYESHSSSLIYLPKQHSHPLYLKLPSASGTNTMLCYLPNGSHQADRRCK